MRDRQGRKLIVKPADLRESPELLDVVATAVRRSVDHGLFVGEMLRQQLGLGEDETEPRHDPDPGAGGYMGPARLAAQLPKAERTALTPAPARVPYE